MGDPLSVLGLGIGAVSLILQLTDECVKGYKYFTEAMHMSESYQYLRVQIHVEQQRFLIFAMEGGLLYADGRISATLQVNQKVLKDVLAEMRSLFQRFEEKNRKYVKIMGQEDIPWADKGEPQTNLMELLNLASTAPTKGDESAESTSLSQDIGRVRNRTISAGRKLRAIFAEPRRFIWASIDKEDFKELIGKLEYLNSFLLGLLDASQATSLKEVIELTYLELLQLRDDVKSLKSLVRALDRYFGDHHEIGESSPPTPGESTVLETVTKERHADAANRQHLRSLAKLKIRHIEIDQPQGPSVSPTLRESAVTLLDFSSFGFSEDDVYSLNSGNQERRWIATWEHRRVWVEWIERSSYPQGERGTESLQEDRVMLLTKLLNESMSPDFRAPQCLGYVKFPRHNEESEFGIVYGPPSECDQESLITLRQILTDRPKPSISSRVALCTTLADCLFSFHAVNWLHKGLRSDNILFFGKEAADLNINMPYITGYDLSRPSEAPGMTEEPPCNPLTDIYRHPAAQFGGARNFYRKSYDMYSLGIVLLEIALWKPIEDILRINDLRMMTANELRGIRRTLLGLRDENGETIDNSLTPGSSEYLTEVAHEWGDSYRDVVEMCLRANDTEKPTYRGESRSSVGYRMRTMFKQQVTDKLQLMKDALSNSD
ncbi:hypothetical protein Hte_010673 [Hypoxylon texense]